MSIKLHQATSQIFIPDNEPVNQAMARTTHLAIGAHQDDLEIMAAKPIIECFQKQNHWFTGVVLTDGRGSPRNNIYQNYTDEEMRLVRLGEQKKAATIGEYAAQIFLDYPSKSIKKHEENKVVDDLIEILQAASPKYIYTHNLADKHDTHVSVALRVIKAIRMLPENKRPEKLYGCEVWRSLDWLDDDEKVPFDLTEQENLQIALLGVFDSQISGGKRYDLATMGRRVSNATFFESHGLDKSKRISFAMDLTPLIVNNPTEISDFVLGHIRRFSNDVINRIKAFE